MPEMRERSIGLNGRKKGFGETQKETSMNPIPHEFAIGGVFMPPLLIAGFFGVIAAVITARLLNRYRLSRCFFYPPLVFLALTIIYTVLIGTLIIGA
jgi:hypothetical protein